MNAPAGRQFDKTFIAGLGASAGGLDQRGLDIARAGPYRASAIADAKLPVGGEVKT